MQNDPIVIVGLAARRWARSRASFKGFAAPELGAAAIRAAVERAGIRPDDVRK